MCSGTNKDAHAHIRQDDRVDAQKVGSAMPPTMKDSTRKRGRDEDAHKASATTGVRRRGRYFSR